MHRVLLTKNQRNPYSMHNRSPPCWCSSQSLHRSARACTCALSYCCDKSQLRKQCIMVFLSCIVFLSKRVLAELQFNHAKHHACMSKGGCVWWQGGC